MSPAHDHAVSSDDRYSVAAGQLVGNYRLEQLIGEGGMGAVFRAVHKDIGRKAAVKVLYRAFARDPEFATRFLNEARAVNLVGHPGLVEIFEFGRLPDETPYIIMEFLEGQSLARRMNSHGRTRQTLKEQALGICRQLAVALAAAHDKGVIHRDLKPENIMLVRDPLVPGTERTKLLDFGIAKVAPLGGKKGPALTRIGSTMGSPLYMSPEQCQELSTVTDRADVYSLGVILYELLSGRTPFVSELPAELMVMHVRNTPPPLRGLVTEIADPVADLVHAMLDKDPSSRPKMHKVAELLGRLAITHAGGHPATQVLWRRRRPLQVGLFSLAAALVLVAVVTGARYKRPPAFIPPKPVVIAVPPSDPVPAVPKTPQTVEWSLTTVPEGAAVLDEATGARLGLTPLKLTRPRQTGRQSIVLRLAGYRDVVLKLEGEREYSIERQLVPNPPAAGGKQIRKRNRDDLMDPTL